MMFLLRLKTLLRCLLLPPAGPLLLAGLGLVLLGKRPRLARVCLVAGMGSLWLCSTPLVAAALVKLVEAYPALDLARATQAQAIVILGGGGQRAQAPEYGMAPMAGPELLERLSYGAYVAKVTGLPLLVTGFHIEATAMHDSLSRNFGVEPRWVEDQAYDTFENAHNSVRLLKAAGVRRIILVTHSMHMNRAVHEFRDAGIEVVPAPTGMRRAGGRIRIGDFVPSPDALASASGALYELAGNATRVLLAASHLRRQ